MFGEKAVITANNSRRRSESRITNLLPNLEKKIELY